MPMKEEKKKKKGVKNNFFIPCFTPFNDLIYFTDSNGKDFLQNIRNGIQYSYVIFIPLSK